MLRILLTLTVLLAPIASYSIDEVGTFWRAKKTQIDNQKASPGELFRLNQVITTTKSSRAKAELRTIDNSRYIIYKNSSIKFEEFEMAGSSCKGMKVSLVQGKMRGTSGSCGHGKTEIKTAVAGAFAWGTDYEMMYVPKGKTIEGYENIPAGFYQKVNEGKVMVSNENGSLLINPGEAGFVGIEGTAPKIIPLPDFFTNVEKPVVKKKKKVKKVKKKASTAETAKKEKKPKTKQKADEKTDIKPKKKKITNSDKDNTKEEKETEEVEDESTTEEAKETEETEEVEDEATTEEAKEEKDTEDAITEEGVVSDTGDEEERDVQEVDESVVSDVSNDDEIEAVERVEAETPENIKTEDRQIAIAIETPQDEPPVLTKTYEKTDLPEVIEDGDKRYITIENTYTVSVYSDGSVDQELIYSLERTTEERYTEFQYDETQDRVIPGETSSAREVLGEEVDRVTIDKYYDVFEDEREKYSSNEKYTVTQTRKLSPEGIEIGDPIDDTQTHNEFNEGYWEEAIEEERAIHIYSLERTTEERYTEFQYDETQDIVTEGQTSSEREMLGEEVDRVTIDKYYDVFEDEREVYSSNEKYTVTQTRKLSPEGIEIGDPIDDTQTHNEFNEGYWEEAIEEERAVHIYSLERTTEERYTEFQYDETQDIVTEGQTSSEREMLGEEVDRVTIDKYYDVFEDEREVYSSNEKYTVTQTRKLSPEGIEIGDPIDDTQTPNEINVELWGEAIPEERPIHTYDIISTRGDQERVYRDIGDEYDQPGTIDNAKSIDGPKRVLYLETVLLQTTTEVFYKTKKRMQHQEQQYLTITTRHQINYNNESNPEMPLQDKLVWETIDDPEDNREKIISDFEITEANEISYIQYKGSESTLPAALYQETESAVGDLTVIDGEFSKYITIRQANPYTEFVGLTENIYDELFDPIANQEQAVKLEFTIKDLTTSDNILYRVYPNDTRSLYSSYAGSSITTSFNAINQSATTPNYQGDLETIEGVTIDYVEDAGNLTLNWGDGIPWITVEVLEKYDRYINNEGSSVSYGFAVDEDALGLGQDSLTSFIYEKQTNDYDQGMKIPKVGSIKYIMDGDSKTRVAIYRPDASAGDGSMEIEDDYSLTEANTEIDFSNLEVTTSIKITNPDNAIIESSPAVSVLERDASGRSLGRFKMTDSDYVDFNTIWEDKELVVSGALMGNGGSHVGLSYIMKLEDTSGTSGEQIYASGAALLKANEATDRQVNGNLILLRSNMNVSDNDPKGMTEMISLTPYSDRTWSGYRTAATDPFSVAPNTNLGMASSLDENNNTTNLFYCAKGERCYRNEDWYNDTPRPTKKITISDYDGNFEQTAVINEGTTSESEIHWGFWQNPKQSIAHLQTAGAPDPDIIHSDGSGTQDKDGVYETKELERSSKSVLFLYEDFAEEGDSVGDMNLPQSGIMEYSIQENSPLIINTEFGDRVSDEYFLSDASLEIDFGQGTNNLTAIIEVSEKDTNGGYINPISSSGPGTLDTGTGRFSVDGGYASLVTFSGTNTDSGQEQVYSSQYGVAKSVGDFGAVGSMLGVNGSHAGMGFQMAVKEIGEEVYEFDNTVSGVILFRATQER